MASELRLGGVKELIAELETLVPDFVTATTPLGRAHAEQTADALRAAYPSITGQLRASVAVDTAAGKRPGRTFARVVARAPYAEWFEFGTAHAAPSPTFVPTTRRGRATFVGAVVAFVRGQGFQVTGEDP